MRRLAFSLLVFLLLLGGTEGALRLWAPLSLNPNPGPLLRGELTLPGDHPVRTSEYSVTVHVNQQGFVDREWGPRNGLRVAVLGDSFVQAAQVEMGQGFGRKLQEELPGVEVLSLGVPGAGTATELGVLERYALPLKPDVVLLGFLVANDVLNNHPLLESKTDKPFYELRGGNLVPSDASTLLKPPNWLEQHVQVAAQVGRALARRAVTEEKLRLGQGMPIDLRLYDPQVSPVWEEAWAVTGALVQEMARRCAAAHVVFGVLLFPSGNEASPAIHQRTVSTWPATAAWDYRLPQGRALTMMGEVPVLDLLLALEGRDDAYFPVDGHWTALGHQRAASATAPFLRRLLPGYESQ